MMLAISVRSVFVSLVISSLAVSAAPALSLKVSGPESVVGVDNLKVVTTVTNTGDESLKILNDPRGPLSKIPTETFAITDTAGSKPDFTGVKVKYVPVNVIAIGKDDAFTVLAPGMSAKVEHDLSMAYNFTRSGSGSYNIEARNLFHYVDPSGETVIPIHADAEAHSASISGVLAVAPSTSVLVKKATFNGCSSSQQTLLNSAASAAQSYVADSLTYLNAHTSSTTRYETWFGTYTTSRHSTAVSHFTKMDGNVFSSYNFDCTCVDSGTYAYVYPDQFGNVYLCGAFWQAPMTGTDSKGGTLVHESSHFTVNGGTADHVYGQEGCKSLAKRNPDQAVQNADSHEYLSENNPVLS